MTAAHLCPRDEADLAELIAGRNAPVAIRGGGTRGGGVGAEVLETGALAGVRLHEPGALTLVAGAGTPLAEVEAVLAAAGQRLAFEPPDLGPLLGLRGASTIGGVVASNASGPRRVQAGACRDALIGARFVDGTGAVVKSGGRVMKNVTGLDLARLMAGARGRLGVLTEVAFKVLPVPEQVLTLRVEAADAGAAVAAMARALGTPCEVTGAAWRPGGPVWLRLEGLEVQLRHRAALLGRLLGAAPAEEKAGGADLWARIRDGADFAGRPGDVWRLALKPSAAPGVLARAGAEDALLDCGGGVMWLLMAPGTDLRARLGPFEGHARRLRGGGADGIADAPPEAPALAALTAGLRARFDPRGLFNPAGG
ncbi:MAG: FAD-binding protein [Gemmobacter sp.]|jgi:glycolate oxidase FAD binding subunit